MKKTLCTLIMTMASALSFVSCAQTGGKTAAQRGGKAENKTTKKSMEKKSENKKVLVAFFSHTGENYAVGNITKGNTHIVAEMIPAETGGRLFEIVPVKPYPKTYNACVDEARKELSAGARPDIKGDAPVEDYDTIYLGYPNWWGDMPMAVYTFIEKHRWQGKTVIPFCTHEGSGLSATEQGIARACSGATVGKGLAIKGSTAQNSQDAARKAVQKWLAAQ